MSSPRFASITASLLARKGEARPWDSADREALPWRPEAATPMPAVMPTFRDAAPPAGISPQKEKSCALRMSPHDYERLGILSVKMGVSRQQLLQRALAQFLEREAQARACSCLGSGENCCTGPGCQ